MSTALSPGEPDPEVQRRDLLRVLDACDSRVLSINLLAAHGQIKDAHDLLRLLASDIEHLVLVCFHNPPIADLAAGSANLDSVVDPVLRRTLKEPGFAVYLATHDFPAGSDLHRTLRAIDRILIHIRRTLRHRHGADLSTGRMHFQASASLRAATLAALVVLLLLGGFVLHQRSLYSANLALGRPAAQSSTSEAATANRAVDGNEDSDYTHGSVSSTKQEPQPWWEVDLGEAAPIRSIQVWHRSDCCVADRLANFYIFVSTQPFAGHDVQASLAQVGVSAYYFGRALPYYSNPVETSISRRGRYIRIQLTGTGPLELAEVKVWRVLGPFLSIY